ncbi:aminodeoxychorismate synthase subunit II [Bacteroidales bacterium]|nr:aminodeoxychorismate synthase subunit II [Bacteroidales bacterium]
MINQDNSPERATHNSLGCEPQGYIKTKKILIFDNYDSFTYNLVHLVKELGYTDVDVFRNDKISLDEVEKYDKIILSPGPGLPSESGLLLPLIKRFAATKSIFGVCLGHQAIAEVFGAKLINLENVYHGIASDVRIIAQDYLFDSMNETFQAGRYHSWLVESVNLPECLTITAVDQENQIMALKHNTFDLHGVQFHPESILTPEGKILLRNFLKR